MESASSLDRFGSSRVLVIGDVMLDRYLWGQVSRISPEAPVQVVRVRDESEVLGGAGNVAANLAGLKCPVDLLGLRGEDHAGARLQQILAQTGIEADLIIDASRPTITKARVMAHGQQLLRLDQEEIKPLASKIEARLIGSVKERLPHCGAVILSDYGKGLLCSRETVQAIIALAAGRRIPVLVDPKGNDWERYHGATCITPNTAEFEAVAELLADTSDSTFRASAESVKDRYELDWLLITRGPRGMVLLGEDGMHLSIPAQAREVFDVSGAGDTVIATLAAGIASGLSLPEAALLANAAAGIVVGKLGTQPVGLEELKAAVQMNANPVNGVKPGKIALLETAEI